MRPLKSLWIILALALVTTGCSGSQGPTPTVAPDAAATPLPPPPTGKTVTADGQLTSGYPSLSLGFGGGVSGEVLDVTVRAGDSVAAGDLLARLDETDLQRDADEAHRSLERAKQDHEAALAQWERDLADASQDLTDAQRGLATAHLRHNDTALVEARIQLTRTLEAEEDRKGEYDKATRFWPPIPVDDYRASWHRAIEERRLAELRLADAVAEQEAQVMDVQTEAAKVASAERALAKLEAGLDPSYQRAIEDAELELERALDALEHAHLTAPWDGIVLSVDVAPAAQVGADTAIVTLLSTEDGLHFVTQSLSEQHIADIEPGQPAHVTLRTFSESRLEGTVQAVVPQVDAAKETDGRFTVHVGLAPTDLRLLPGLTGRVEIITGE